MSMPRYALRIAYDGTDYCGWWRQPDRPSVASMFDAAFERIGEAGAEPMAASRTDAGVHAEAQVAHVACQRAWQPHALVHALNTQLPQDIACTAAAAVADDWHAVFTARGKTYRYEIDNGHSRNPLRQRYSWRPPGKPALAALQAVAALVPGDRDWSAFARSNDPREDYRRSITTVVWTADAERLLCHVSGAAFTYHLVRSLVGAMCACAGGQCEVSELKKALNGEVSRATDFQAPARGLCLEQVTYDPEPAWETQQ